jgi:hypothetical protein
MRKRERSDAPGKRSGLEMAGNRSIIADTSSLVDELAVPAGRV